MTLQIIIYLVAVYLKQVTTSCNNIY